MTNEKNFNLYVSNLSPVATRNDIFDYFEACGFPVRDLWLIKKHRTTGELLRRCHGFVALENPEQTAEAIAALARPKEFLGTRIWVKAYRTPAEQANYRKPGAAAPTFAQRLAWARTQEAEA
jgi:hypothetical protein